MAAGLLTLALVVGCWSFIQKDYWMSNLYAHQAAALLQGRLDIGQKLYDVALFGDKYYVPFPPFPAIVLLPFVALWGVAGTKVIYIAIAISAISAVLFVRVMDKLGVQDFRQTLWLGAAFFLGTAYWSMVRNSYGVWFFAHTVAVCCMLMAIGLALGRGTGVLVGLCVGLAFLSRQLSIFSAPFLAVVLWRHARYTTLRARVINLMGFGLALGVCGAIYLWFNWARFGNPLDTGYAYIPLFGILEQRVERYGLFNWRYVPFNVVYMFLQGYHVVFGPPGNLKPMGTDPFGTAITFASPFVFAALRAKWDTWLKWAAWLSIGLILLNQLLYYNNGSMQWNAQRFTLDFMPILILLIALGLPQINPKLWKGAILYAVALNVLTLLIIG